MPSGNPKSPMVGIGTIKGAFGYVILQWEIVTYGQIVNRKIVVIC